MIEDLLPAHSVGVVAWGDRAGPAPSAEQAWSAAFSPARRAEFSTVRVCAREALATLGFAGGPLLPGSTSRAPIWPAGVVGSLTHCPGCRAAAVAPRRYLAGLGIDVDVHRPLPGGCLRMITHRGERRDLAELANGATHWDRVLFSVKESVYKCCQPLSGQDHDWGDVEVRLLPHATRPRGLFLARVTARWPGVLPAILVGRWKHSPRWVASTLALPARPGPRTPPECP